MTFMPKLRLTKPELPGLFRASNGFGFCRQHNIAYKARVNRANDTKKISEHTVDGRFHVGTMPNRLMSLL